MARAPRFDWSLTWVCTCCEASLLGPCVPDIIEAGTGQPVTHTPHWTPCTQTVATFKSWLSRVHVATPDRWVEAEAVRSTAKVPPSKVVRPQAVIEGLKREALRIHRANRRQYVQVMGHAPMPDEALIRRVMMGEFTAAEVGL